MQADKPTRIIVYVDGYNVYHGFKRKGWEKHLWLDYVEVFNRVRLDGQEIRAVKYFTAPTRRQGSNERQDRYLEALRINGGGLQICLGKTVNRPYKCPGCKAKRCPQCDAKFAREQEKETDVNMAIEMLLDCFDDEVDELWLMSRDYDLVPVVKKVTERFGKKVLVIPPPDGSGGSSGADSLVAAAGGEEFRFHVGAQVWRQSQLPDELQRKKGAKRVKRPTEWA